jgi:hypothetical protein
MIPVTQEDHMIWWLIGFAVVGAPLTLVLHELSHCFAVWAKHGWITSFKPWPHKVDGRFYFGRMTYAGCAPDEKAFSIAPLIKAITLLGLWLVLALALFWPLLALAGWESTDIINWVQGYIRSSPNDGGRYRRAGAV